MWPRFGYDSSSKLRISKHTRQTLEHGCEVVTDEWWFYVFEQILHLGPWLVNPLVWEDGEPREQGEFYCGVGATNVVGREISDAFGCMP